MSGSGILQPQMSHQFRVVLGDHIDDFPNVTTAVKSADVDFIKKTVTIKLRETAHANIPSQLIRFKRYCDRLDIQYLNGQSAEYRKAVTFKGKVKKAKTKFDYSVSDIAYITLVFKFDSFTEHSGEVG
jgi:hypothetical protein